MYDPPWVSAANDRVWAGLRDRLRAAGVSDVPERLERTMSDEQMWRSSHLLLAQTCGYPLLKLGDAVQVVATPCYEFDGCDGPNYRSLLTVRADLAAGSVDRLRGVRAAVNNWDSHSGMNAFRAVIAHHAGGRPFFADVVTTGSHLLSLAALREGRADVAAIDCVSYGLVLRHRPELLAGTRVVGETPSCPGLPLVTAAATPQETVAVLRRVLRDVLRDEALAESRAALGLVGFSMLPAAAYEAIAAMERAAVALGYPVLA